MKTIFKSKGLLIIFCLVTNYFNSFPQDKKEDRPTTSNGLIKEEVFKPTVESLKKYKCPEWFRDAKFGIWAVWGPESVPMIGDWYAHNMYIEGSPQYDFQTAQYGHSSKFGFKDIIPLWKAERWDPEHLMSLYKKAGAKYFCMIAMHHDNFDCWNSKYNKWNSVNMGPKRDIAAEWQKAAKNQGLYFGMTEHLAASFWFFGASKGHDKYGPMANIPYDGANPKYADLYWKGNENLSFHYYSDEGTPESFKKIWFKRIKNLIDSYHPDLLYSDSPLPYPEQAGRELLSYYYTDNMNRHDGNLEAVYNCKEISNGCWVQDLERGVQDTIQKDPWQTDTCIGDWYYQTNIDYKSATSILQMLADIVSKNGNLLLNFPLLPNGTLDARELKIIDDLSLWMPINGEAIFGTRPWKKFGEGPSKVEKGASFNEAQLKYTSQDIRFTTKKGELYAIILAWPNDGKVTVKSLSKFAGDISNVVLLGSDQKIGWKQNYDELSVVLPEKKPCDHVFVLKISGKGII